MTVPTVIPYVPRSIKTDVKKKKRQLNSCDLKMNGFKNIYFPFKLVPVRWYMIVIPALWRPRQEPWGFQVSQGCRRGPCVGSKSETMWVNQLKCTHLEGKTWCSSVCVHCTITKSERLIVPSPWALIISLKFFKDPIIRKTWPKRVGKRLYCLFLKEDTKWATYMWKKTLLRVFNHQRYAN